MNYNEICLLVEFISNILFFIGSITFLYGLIFSENDQIIMMIGIFAIVAMSSTELKCRLKRQQNQLEIIDKKLEVIQSKIK